MFGGLVRSIIFDKQNTYKSMQIEQDIIEKWRDLRKWGDAKELANLAQCSRESVYLAFRTGKASTHLFSVMSAYYMQRMAFYDHLTQTLNDYQ